MYLAGFIILFVDEAAHLILVDHVGPFDWKIVEIGSPIDMALAPGDLVKAVGASFLATFWIEALKYLRRG
jgi:hypothetical protein